LIKRLDNKFMVKSASDKLIMTQPIFIYDNLTNTYNDIRNGLFEVSLPVGVNNSRFSIRFNDKTLEIAKNNTATDAIRISQIQNENALLTNKKTLDTTVDKVTLYNILGQSISTWKVQNQNQENIKIPIKSVRSGVYIAKLNTSEGEISKKVIVFDD